MHFNYFVIAGLATVSTHALSIYKIIAQMPVISITGPNIEMEEGPSVTAVPEFCQKNLVLTEPLSAKILKDCMKKKKDLVGQSFFYTNPYKPKDGIDYAKESDKWKEAHKDLDLKTLDEFWLTPEVKQWAYDQAERITKEGLNQRSFFWRHASRAMAELSSGTVRVIMPESVDPVNKPKDVKRIFWYDIECPTLAGNPLVKEVYKVWPGSEDKAEKVDFKDCKKTYTAH